MNVIKKIIRFILKTALGLAVFLLLYGLIVFITSIIPVNKNKSLDTHNTIPVYILSNGVQTRF